ncbi:hypothetical protein GGI07_001323, partial [Coemansia sp. Benny D115]
MVAKSITAYSLVVVALAKSYAVSATAFGSIQGLEPVNRPMFSGLALYDGNYESVNPHPNAYRSSAPYSAPQPTYHSNS